MVEREERISFLIKMIKENDMEPDLRKVLQEKLNRLLYETTEETYRDDDQWIV